jgi:hypothetical protein
MRALSAIELLDVWEYGHARAPTQRALDLLAAACPETSRDSLAVLSIGQRDARLLTLRERVFGSQMTGVAVCPGCGERLELTLNTEEMRSNFREELEAEISLSVAGYDVCFRLPNGEDAIAAANQADVDSGRSLILERCLLSSRYGEAPVDSVQLPPEIVETVTQRMAEADPLADIQIVTSCPSCEHRWRAAFDVVSFFWIEIEAWAWRMLSDVHTLAAAYGWRERDILALSPLRRQYYLEMVGA